MTFDDQIRRAFDTLTVRLGDDIRREVQIAAGEVTAARAEREAELARDIETARKNAARDVDAAKEALARGVDAAVSASITREAGAVAAVRASASAEAAAAARSSAAALEAAVAAGQAHAVAGDRLLAAVRSIGGARSLSETLDLLASCAAREAERAAVFTVRAHALVGWRFAGFGPRDQDPASDAPFDDRGLSDRARHTNAVVIDDGACAIPIAIGGEVVAVLYADAGGSNPESRPSTGSGRPELVEGRTPNPVAMELLARHAVRTLEALVAFKAARALSAPAPTSDPIADLRPDGSPPPLSGNNDDDEDVAARRYARLLVSEIRLYHETDVVAGCRARDLVARLGGEIARARSLYDERIPPHVRQRASYFDEELVRTLADGDASLLNR